MFLVGSLFVKGLENKIGMNVSLRCQAEENKENRFFYITSNQKLCVITLVSVLTLK